MSEGALEGSYTSVARATSQGNSGGRGGYGSVDLAVSSNDPRARARFINLATQKKVKEFKLKMRNYKRPDFNRMILDLNRMGWTHEKIAHVLPVAGASTVSEWARGGVPNYENGDAFVILWRTETGIDREPREGEMGYRYKIGQLDMFEDWNELDAVIEQLDRELEK